MYFNSIKIKYKKREEKKNKGGVHPGYVYIDMVYR